MSDSVLLFLIFGFIAAVFAVIVLSVWRTDRRVLNPARRIARMTDPVEGTLIVTAAPAMSTEAIWQSRVLTGILSAQGIEPHAAQKEMLMTSDRWPVVGQSLPVVVDRARPSDWVVPWGRVPRQEGHALAEAERIAAAVRADADARSSSEPS
jgi:hypothetical protein